MPESQESLYIPRFLSGRILSSHAKVVIVEGARAVGKTKLAHEELESEGFMYYSLADTTTYNYARNDIEGWVNSLSLPAIIDEAQRIEGLTLAIKERVDKSDENKTQFILTGSASIGKKGLDHQDPLTRRSQRFTLFPFTQGEIYKRQTDLIQSFLEGTPNTEFQETANKDNILGMMQRGGFPNYALEMQDGNLNEISLRISDDIQSILGETVLPKERLDLSIAQDILQALLGIPGGILNVSKIGNLLGYDHRTIESYISKFIQRFLVYSLPNINTAANRQTIARSKIHPVDTSFSCSVLKKAGKSLENDSVLLGQLFESFVVTQFVAAAQGSKMAPTCFYWRESGANPNEVDLVLVSNNELVGIEVKLSQQIDSHDFNGLRGLAQNDVRFKRGFVIYLGSRFYKQSENLWGVPVAALWRDDAFKGVLPMDNAFKKVSSTNTATTRPIEQENQTMRSNSDQHDASTDASVFLSYNHDDNDHLNNAIVQLADDIVEEYLFEFGSNLDLFVDGKSIRWGQSWQDAIDEAIEKTTFIMPAVTPRYIASAACRDELQKFQTRAIGKNENHILSLIWQEYEDTEAARQNPDIVNEIQIHQFEDVSGLRDLDKTDKDYKQRIRELVAEIRKAIETDEKKIKSLFSSASAQEESQSSVESDEGILDQLEELDQFSENFKVYFGKATDDLNIISPALEEFLKYSPNKISDLNKGVILLFDKTKEPLDDMKNNLKEARTCWENICDLTKSYINLLGDLPQSMNEPANLIRLLTSLLSLQKTVKLPENTDNVLENMRMLARLSSRLIPLNDGVKEYFNTLKDISNSVDDLIDQLNNVLE